MIRQFFQRLGYGLRNFMVGRYGTDKLNMAILSAGLAVCLISVFFDSAQMHLLLTGISYALMIWALCRCLGISTQKLHARGPMALAEITTYKWLIEGEGQVRS